MSQQIIKLVAKGSLLSVTQVRLTFYYGCNATGWSDDDLDVCKSGVKTLLSDLMPVITADTIFYGIDAYTRDAENKWILRRAYVLSTHGTSEDTLNVFQLAVLLEGITGVFRSRGKKFIPGIAKVFTDHGSIASGAFGYVITALADYVTPVYSMETKREWFPGIMSKRAEFAPFLSGSINLVLSTLRCRKPGYGM
jgi:hypothetical protein